MDNNKTVGDLIRESRIKYGFKTQREFAIKTGISTATLSRIEKNTQKPTPETLQQISRFLGNVTYGELMKASGYLSGMGIEDEEYLKRLMDDNERLDNKIKTILDSFYFSKSFRGEIFPEIKRLLLKYYRYPNIDLNTFTLYSDYSKMDFSDTEKSALIKDLEILQNKFLPKMLDYNISLKNITPIPLFKSIESMFLKKEDSIIEYLHYPYLGKYQPDFAIRMYDDSLNQCSISKNDIVFIRRTSNLEENTRIVCVYFTYDDRFAIKRIEIDEVSRKLVLFSDGYKGKTDFVMYDSIKHLTLFGIYIGHFSYFDTLGKGD